MRRADDSGHRTDFTVESAAVFDSAGAGAMPIYEYQCQSCNHQMEVLQKLSDEPLTDCPACGAAAVKKKVSAVAFRLKGGGWYETDFKSGDKKNLAGSEKSDSPSDSTAKSDASGSGTSDSGSGTSESGSGTPGSGTSGSSDNSTSGAVAAN